MKQKNVKQRFWGLASVRAALLLPLLLFAAIHGVSAGGRGGESAAPRGTQAAAPGPFGAYTPPIELTAVKNLGAGNLLFPPGDSIDNNVWTRYYQEVLGVKVKYTWTTNEQQYAQKVNIAITSNDIPDIMMVNNVQLKMMHENGQARDMTAILPEYLAPFTREVIYQDNGDAIKSATFDGKLYAIPLTGFGLSSAMVLWVRTDWLTRLGLSIPKTPEEFLAVANAFTNRDPDGNGRKDTFGLAVYKDLFEGGFACLEGFFNMYGAYPHIWVPSGAGLEFGSVQPAAKTALGVLQDMYRAGLLDPEFGVKDALKVAEDVMAGRFGLMFGQFWNAAWINAAKVANPAIEWVPVSIPFSAAGKAQMPFGTTSYAVISARSKNPEAAVKLLNLQLEKTYGATAESTRFNITPDGFSPYAYTVLGIEPGMKNFDAAAAVSSAINNRDPSRLNEEQLNYYEMSLKSLAGDHDNNNWHQLKMFGPGGSLTVIRGYWDRGKVQPDQFFGVPTPAMTEKLSTLNKQVLTDYTGIILGTPLDSGWDSFIRSFGVLGGSRMTAEVNEWYRAR
ncbi:MAG: extracellular solute-binding protein [Treponema sp.]|jgi:putative aldouronate transport system substrate-binding protein|nr:extracellular solute-binding protein [Treponema sp.]